MSRLTDKEKVLNDVIDDILQELERAEKKFPVFPVDKIHAVSIMNEEAGEAIQAALNFHYLNGDINDIRKELIQTAAMAIRNLINL